MAPDVLTPRHDLTLEAAFAKLHVLTDSGLQGSELRNELAQVFCGECAA